MAADRLRTEMGHLGAARRGSPGSVISGQPFEMHRGGAPSRRSGPRRPCGSSSRTVAIGEVLEPVVDVGVHGVGIEVGERRLGHVVAHRPRPARRTPPAGGGSRRPWPLARPGVGTGSLAVAPPARSSTATEGPGPASSVSSRAAPPDEWPTPRGRVEAEALDHGHGVAGEAVPVVVAARRLVGPPVAAEVEGDAVEVVDEMRGDGQPHQAVEAGGVAEEQRLVRRRRGRRWRSPPRRSS